ncbi:MAG TPA: hypothetical protein VD978_12485 [Azospirillum sp.]|nr:hypothetical protein [Azospirillum sp.]
MKNQIDASAIDLLDEEACLEAIFHASHAMAPGHRAEALEWGAAYLDLLRSRITAPHTAMPTRRKPCEALA